MTKTRHTHPRVPSVKMWRWNRDFKDLVEVEEVPDYFIDDLGRVCISAEDGKGWADYYGEFQNNDGLPWIHPELESWAEGLAMHWEWNDPGSIALSL